MNILVVFVLGLAVIAFGPWFLIQGILGYILGGWIGSYAEVRMRDLHCEICRRTGDKESNIDDLAKYVAKASKIGGLLCPVIPVAALIVGFYCACKAEHLRSLRTCVEVEETCGGETTAYTVVVPCFNMDTSARIGVRL